MAKRKHNHPDYSLETIDSASRAELNSRFEAEFRRKPGPRTSLVLMRQNLAWAAQARTAGDHPQQQRRRLIKALELPYRPGTRLIREFQGTVYEVTVLDKGYAWEGRTYTNLSRIATEITGTKWSGPRFFGLTGGKHG
jgi:hypothetical protein